MGNRKQHSTLQKSTKQNQKGQHTKHDNYKTIEIIEKLHKIKTRKVLMAARKNKQCCCQETEIQQVQVFENRWVGG